MRSLATLVAIGMASPSFAQDAGAGPLPLAAGPPARPAEQGWSITVGVAPIVGPAWLGSRDTTLSIYPDLRINYGDVLFASVPDGLGWNAVNGDGWKAGPIAKIRFGRDEDDGGSPFLVSGGSQALRGLGDVGAAAELGGFVEKRFGRDRSWRLRGEVRRGFGGHEGVIGDASLTYRLRAGSTTISAGPRASFASKAFMQRYFGIDAGQSARSGLPQHRAKGGLLSYGVGGSLVHALDRRSALTVFAGLDRLASAAASSPLIEQRGRRAQFTLGLGYGWRFGL